ncbi:MAG: hypothetical protein H8E78_11315 [Proteobacteria bacterium]|nr:hypothetical protein [Pseudomonadota bacterium]
MGIAAEHLATGILRSLLGSSLQQTTSSTRGPRIIFATPTGERHELGGLIAAVTALGAGASPLFLGVDLPVNDLLRAADETGAVALALSLVTIPTSEATRVVVELREGLTEATRLWLGGSGAGALELPVGAEHIASLENLEQRIGLLQV